MVRKAKRDCAARRACPDTVLANIQRDYFAVADAEFGNSAIHACNPSASAETQAVDDEGSQVIETPPKPVHAQAHLRSSRGKFGPYPIDRFTRRIRPSRHLTPGSRTTAAEAEAFINLANPDAGAEQRQTFVLPARSNTSVRRCKLGWATCATLMDSIESRRSSLRSRFHAPRGQLRIRTALKFLQVRSVFNFHAILMYSLLRPK
jgi:hypothetical protein